ncbi:hypothetical protein FACS1894111_08050 [Clostridia bacterium]|nr:hypothetical protein FACS1894111_08050 [Clostridia bacterium]
MVKKIMVKKLMIAVVMVFSLVNVFGFGVNAASWDVRYVKGAPSSEQKSTTLTFTTRSSAYTANCTSMTSATNRSVTIAGTNVSIEGGNKVMNNTGSISWKIDWNNPPSTSSFNFSGYSSTAATFTASGTAN